MSHAKSARAIRFIIGRHSPRKKGCELVGTYSTELGRVERLTASCQRESPTSPPKEHNQITVLGQLEYWARRGRIEMIGNDIRSNRTEGRLRGEI